MGFFVFMGQTPETIYLFFPRNPPEHFLSNEKPFICPIPGTPRNIFCFSPGTPRNRKIQLIIYLFSLFFGFYLFVFLFFDLYFEW